MLDVAPSHRALVQRLVRQRLPHCRALAFGSRVLGWPSSGGAKPFSDLDVALWGLRPSDDPALAHLRADFEESALPWRVDVCNAQDLPEPLRDLVVRLGEPLDGNGARLAQAA